MGRPYQEKYATVRWETNQKHLQAWQEGRTGVPIVDAAMRQMNAFGMAAFLSVAAGLTDCCLFYVVQDGCITGAG